MKYQIENLKDCQTWEQFIEEWKQVEKIREDAIRNNDLSSFKGICVPNLIFRGQSNSTWDLKTTLERFGKKTKYSIEEYYRKILEASFQVETFTKEKWKLPTLSYYANLLKKLKPFTPHNQLFPTRYDVANYFLYLRHHGFPSPMLDWTRSAYIAAYFAFGGQPNPAEKVSIFIFLESITGLTRRGNAPTINSLGRNVKSHERHFLQQCEYTFCLQEDSEGKHFVSHEEAFASRPNDQQYRWKFDIPSTEREKVLKFLDSVNINAFSLFGSIESLMTTTAERYF